MLEAQGLIFTTHDEIKILELLKSSNCISFIITHIEDIPYYALLAKIRDFQKIGFVTSIDGIYNISEQGIEYLNKLLDSN